MQANLGKLVAILFTTLFSISLCYADVTLPTPQMKGGMGLFDSLKKRTSTPGGGFPTDKLSNEELSTVLWAASGLNRGNNGWTVPMAKGKQPYVRIYVAGENGLFLYEWQGHYLRQISNKDIRADVGMQNFTKRAAYALIFVSDAKVLSDFPADQANDFSQMATGAISQNIYLAASALKLSARYIHSIQPTVISQELQLESGNHPIGLILLGK